MDDKDLTPSEQAVHEQLGEVADDPVARATENARDDVPAATADAMSDPADHEAVPFDNEASNPGSTGPEGLSGDWGVSSERTTESRPRSDGHKDVSPGTNEAPDVSRPDFEGYEDRAPASDDDDNPMWGDVVRTGSEPRPEVIDDEKSRREGGSPPDLPR